MPTSQTKRPASKTRYEYKPPEAEMRATEPNPYLEGISSGLGYLRDSLDTGNILDVATLGPVRRLLNGEPTRTAPPTTHAGPGSLMMGHAPEEIHEWASGFSPFSEEPNYGNRLDPRIKPGREQGVMDVGMLGLNAIAPGMESLANSVRPQPGWTTYRGGQYYKNYEDFVPSINRSHAIDKGLGLYTTQNEQRARHYADKSGTIVNKLRVLAPRDTYLMHDRKLSEQPEAVIDGLKKLGLYEGNENIYGSELYHMLEKKHTPPKTSTSKFNLQRNTNVPYLQKANDELMSGGIYGMQNNNDYIHFNLGDIQNHAEGGSVTMPDNYRSGGRVRMI